jgi:hypothetical protein
MRAGGRRSLIQRAGRAVRLDAGVYGEARDDPGATVQALLVVVAVAGAHGVGDVIRALLVGDEIDARWQTAWIFGVTGELVYWTVSTLVVVVLAPLLFRRRTPARALVRVLGLAAAPGVLIVAAAALSAALPPPAVLLPILVARLVAAVQATRAATALGWLRSGAIVVLAGVAGVAAVLAATSLLYA